MARLVAFFSLSLALSHFSGVLAGPACARKHYQAANCVQLCKSRWGWSGSLMGTDPWGAVMQTTDSSGDNVLSKACGSTVAASATASSTVIIPTSSVSPTASIAAPLAIHTSSTVKSSSASSTSSTSSSSISTKSVSTAAFAALPSSKAAVASTSTTAAPKTSTTPAAAAPATTTPNAAATTTTRAAQTTAAPASSNSGSSSGSTSDSDIQAYLSGHNTIRAQHGASALTWSDELASKAQQWANGCVFQHSGGSLGAFGENLAAGTGSSYGIASAIKSWTDEVSEYDSSNPQPSHFTQVVWKGTSQVGCALQSCDGIFAASFGKAKFYVCEYSAQGNVIGQFAQNVQA